MILSNFANYIINGFRDINNSYTTRNQKATNGNNFAGSQTSYANRPDVVIGAGDTPPQLSDYNLESPLSLTVTMRSWTVSSDTQRLLSSVTVYRNDTDSPVTVKEVGFQMFFGSSYPQVLIARSILDTPVTINPGESYAFTYSIEI